MRKIRRLIDNWCIKHAAWQPRGFSLPVGERIQIIVAALLIVGLSVFPIMSAHAQEETWCFGCRVVQVPPATTVQRKFQQTLRFTGGGITDWTGWYILNTTFTVTDGISDVGNAYRQFRDSYPDGAIYSEGPGRGSRTIDSPNSLGLAWITLGDLVFSLRSESSSQPANSVTITAAGQQPIVCALLPGQVRVTYTDLRGIPSPIVLADATVDCGTPESSDAGIEG